MSDDDSNVVAGPWPEPERDAKSEWLAKSRRTPEQLERNARRTKTRRENAADARKEWERLVVLIGNDRTHDRDAVSIAATVCGFLSKFDDATVRRIFNARFRRGEL